MHHGQQGICTYPTNKGLPVICCHEKRLCPTGAAIVIQSKQNGARVLLVHHAHNKCCGRCHTPSQHNAILVHGRCETPVCRIAHGHVRHAGPSKHAWSSLVKRCAGRHMQTKQELIAQQPCFVHCILILNTQRAKPVRRLDL